jgi:hypothetical protein
MTPPWGLEDARDIIVWLFRPREGSTQREGFPLAQTIIALMIGRAVPQAQPSIVDAFAAAPEPCEVHGYALRMMLRKGFAPVIDRLYSLLEAPDPATVRWALGSLPGAPHLGPCWQTVVRVAFAQFDHQKPRFDLLEGIHRRALETGWRDKPDELPRYPDSVPRRTTSAGSSAANTVRRSRLWPSATSAARRTPSSAWPFSAGSVTASSWPYRRPGRACCSIC